MAAIDLSHFIHPGELDLILGFGKIPKYTVVLTDFMLRL